MRSRASGVDGVGHMSESVWLGMDILFFAEDDEGNVFRVRSPGLVCVVVKDQAEVQLQVGVEKGEIVPPGPGARLEPASGSGTPVLHIEAHGSQ